ncbi:MAG: class I SAM-dependent methyltransferase, partial [Desulfosporosinus sp.]
VRCQDCQMVHVEPMPSYEQAKEFYQINGIAHYDQQYVENRINDKNIEHRLKIYRNAILKYASKGDSVLDVGCHDAAFLKILKSDGFEVYGQEVHKELAEMVQSTYGIPVSSDDFLMYNSNQRFNFVSALSVIEHVPSIEEFVKKIASLIIPEGYLLLEVPNVDSYESRAIYYFFSQTVNYWFEPTPPIHLWEFNKNTIQKFLNKFGFKVIEIQTFSPFGYEKDIAKFPEGYYIAREGLDLLSLETEKRNLLKSLVNNNDDNYRNILKYIAKFLIKKTFEECEIFSEVADNKAAIWVLAQKVR